MAVIEGDPFGDKKDEKGPVSPEPREVNLFHTRSDVDSANTAQHHTLGVKHNQASPGDHVHDGTSSRKVGTGMGLTVNLTAGSEAEALAQMLQDVIEFNIT